MKTILTWVTPNSSWKLAEGEEHLQVLMDADLSFLHKGDQIEVSMEVQSQLITRYPEAAKWIKSPEFKHWSYVVQTMLAMDGPYWVVAIGETLQEVVDQKPTIKQQIEFVERVLESNDFLAFIKYDDQMAYAARELCKLTGSHPDAAVRFLRSYFPTRFLYDYS